MYKIYSLLIILNVFFMELSAVKNYGQFEMALRDARSCKGPKRKECANTTIIINGKASIFCNITVSNNIPPIKGKILGFLDNEEVFKINVGKPCNHIFFTPLLKVLVKITDKCIILKGYYVFTLDLEEIISSYHDAAFMFGNWTYKALFYNDDCNFTCGIFQMSVTAKKTT